jgi:hypothetical protein
MHVGSRWLGGALGHVDVAVDAPVSRSADAALGGIVRGVVDRAATVASFGATVSGAFRSSRARVRLW